MKLFANGCSFTWGGALYKSLYDNSGSLLDYNNTSHENSQRLKDVWPYHLSKLLDLDDCVNLSIGCGSNDRILRTTLNFFTNIHNEYDLSQWIAVIQWTQPARYEYWDEDTQSWAMVIPNSNVNLGKKVDHDIIERLNKYKDSTYAYQTNKTHAQKYWTQIVSLAAFFEHLGIPYWFSNLSIDLFNELDTFQKEYLEKKVRWLTNAYDTFNFLFEDKFESTHPSLLGHQQIAQSIHTIIKNQL